VCIILISFPHIYLAYKTTKLDIHVFITRLSYMTITLNNTTGTRCEAGDVLPLLPTWLLVCILVFLYCWFNTKTLLICILENNVEKMHSNNFCREIHGTRGITLDEIWSYFWDIISSKSIHISLRHHFKHSILFIFLKTRF
jgi:hypothetical protein